MAFNIFKNFLDTNQKDISRYKNKLEQIYTYADEYKDLTNEQIKAKTASFRKQILDGKKLDDLLPEAFALTKEAIQRVTGFTIYDEQLMAAMAFHEGKIAEQKTGEGKTLSAVPALYLNALTGRGVHLVTVNDYLARRDAGWNGGIFHLLDISVGVVVHNDQLQGLIYDLEYIDQSHDDERLKHLKPVARKESYQADITYGTNTEFGFDYLRDNMARSKEDQSQRGHYYAIVDEVDSILIDEARTPLIISAPDAEPTDKYLQFAQIATKLSLETDFTMDEKHRSIALTDHGIKKLEKILHIENLYEKDFELIHHIENALKAKMLYVKDRHYVSRDGQIIIVDEFTGRLMPGRRWSDGMHQAVEAKEGLKIQQESKTLATVSLQNYFRMYQKLSGMTGTAATEGEEFRKIYNLDVVIIPTHKPIARKDFSDIVYKTTRAKYTAIANLVEDLHKKGQPVLIGTTSIQKNEIISQLLSKKQIPHQVLNAKNHEKEASIISQAGKIGAVTVATNIAGRGVDIVLGGAKPILPKNASDSQLQTYQKELEKWQKEHDKVLETGGLYIIGSERHESRRIDNQLRGRSGRQGDNGSSQFFVSLDDEIMRLFGGEQVSKLMTMLKLPEDQPLEVGMVSKAIEQAQSKVEGFHFDQRKYLVEYDDVLNKQREIIYKLRQKTLEKEDFHEQIIEKSLSQINQMVEMYSSDGLIASEISGLAQEVAEMVPMSDSQIVKIKTQLESSADARSVQEILHEIINHAYKAKEKQLGFDAMREVERFAIRRAIDILWVEHLDRMEDLREGIGLRSYGQRDPLVEYKQEAFGQFEKLINDIDYQSCREVLRIQVAYGDQLISNINLMQSESVKPESLNESTLSTISTLSVQDNALSTTSPKRSKSSDADQNLSIKTKGGLDAFASAMQAIKPEIGSSAKTTKNTSASQKQNKPGRNDPCWCNSGKKYKKCHFPN